MHLDEIPGMPPVAQGREVAEVEAILQADGDTREGAGDLARDKGFAADRALVIEEDAVAGIDAIGFAVIDGDPVGVEFGDGVGAAGSNGVICVCGVSCTSP